LWLSDVSLFANTFAVYAVDQLLRPTPGDYVFRAAHECGVSLDFATVDDHVQVFRTALYNIEISIREAHVDGTVAEKFAKEDLRPDLKFISFKLREFLEIKATGSISGGGLTLTVALGHLDGALTRLNTAARMFLVAEQTHNDEHWDGYYKSYVLCADRLREARLQLETDASLTG
jgi:hypothetical protein